MEEASGPRKEEVSSPESHPFTQPGAEIIHKALAQQALSMLTLMQKEGALEVLLW